MRKKRSAQAMLFASIISASVLLSRAAVPAAAEALHTPENGTFNPELQRELVIIDSVHTYDLNPHTAKYYSEAQILNGLYEGVFSYDPLTSDALPAAAKNFRISRDRKTWTFTLRDDLKFSNGESISASDVQRSWLELLNPDLQAPYASLLDCVQGAAEYRTGKAEAHRVGITVKDMHTLRLKLKTPTEHLPKILCHPAFAITHKNKEIYSGAFTLDTYTSNLIVLKKNGYYYDADSVALPSVKIIGSDNREENTFAFNTGEVQWITGGIVPEKIYIRSDIIAYPQFGTEFYFFKTHKAPWNNRSMRQALLAAIPVEELQKTAAVPAHTLILPLNGYPEIYGSTEYDMEEAKNLLEQGLSAWKNKAEKKAARLTLCIPDFDYAKNQAAIIADALGKLGITLLIETAPANRYLEGIRESEADMFTYTWIGDFADPLAFLELFRGGSSSRETAWTSDHFDSLLEEASRITDSGQRYKKLAEAEQLLLDEAVILPVSHPISVNAVDTGVLGGWFPNTQDIHPFKYIFFKEAEKDMLPAQIVRSK